MVLVDVVFCMTDWMNEMEDQMILVLSKILYKTVYLAVQYP